MTVSFKSDVSVQDMVNSSISFGGAYGQGFAAGADFSPQTDSVTGTIGFGTGGWGGATGMNVASGFIPVCKG
jgi:hypothetical protein